jgi:hypothetical protein
MVKPRVFVSSTYYDLKYVRSSVENFIEELGFESILSEKGNIAYAPDIPLDQSCYREVGNSDIYVLIIGGRYGAEKSDKKQELPKNFYERYDSITRQEYATAVDNDIPTYILIEKPVYADFETYLRNKENKDIRYAHVDSVNIFRLIEEILSKPMNNPAHHFDKYSDIEDWLREQWAGLFKELLSRMSGQQQLSSLTAQVGELREISKTMKKYLEEVVSKVAPGESVRIIDAEEDRLERAARIAQVRETGLVGFLEVWSIPIESILNAIETTSDFESFVNALEKTSPEAPKAKESLQALRTSSRELAEKDYETITKILLAHPASVVRRKQRR